MNAPKLTPARTALLLRQQANRMSRLAADMQRHDDAEWVRHGTELAGAAEMMRQWAGEIETTTRAAGELEKGGEVSDIDTGDHVLHAPTGEEWVVALVRGDRLSWCGWPEGMAALSDCRLTKKATPEQRDKLLREMADMGGSDHRQRYAQERLAAATQPAASEGPPCAS